MRADQLLLQCGMAQSRSQAQRLIASGAQWRPPGAADWRAIAKSGQALPIDAELLLPTNAETRYVSRAGLKLEAALQAWALQVAGWRCLDIGQSTGGFTDCLLQHGAASVVGVDVGRGQLHPLLRTDARVTCIEGVNARHLTQEQAQAGTAGFHLIVGDVSFISLTLVLPALLTCMRDDTHLVLLVKPQFELQPGQLGKGGIVRDESLFDLVRQRLQDCCDAQSLSVLHWLDSPIQGGDGNREFLLHAQLKAASVERPKPV